MVAGRNEILPPRIELLPFVADLNEFLPPRIRQGPRAKDRIVGDQNEFLTPRNRSAGDQIELIELCTFAIKARMVAVEMNFWPPRIELLPLLPI